MSDPDRKQLMTAEAVAKELRAAAKGGKAFHASTIRRNMIPLHEWISSGRFATGDVPFVQLFGSRYVPRWWVETLTSGGIEPQWLSDALDAADDA